MNLSNWIEKVMANNTIDNERQRRLNLCLQDRAGCTTHDPRVVHF